MNIRRFPDPESLSRAAADHIADLARKQERVSIALSGGSTPKRTYQILAGLDLQDKDVFEGYNYGADKPFHPMEIASAVERALAA